MLETVRARVKQVPQTKRMKDKYTVEKCSLTAKLMREGAAMETEKEDVEEEEVEEKKVTGKKTGKKTKQTEVKEEEEVEEEEWDTKKKGGNKK